MTLDDDELAHLARLARLSLPDDRRDALRDDLATVLAAFQEVRTADDDPERAPLLRPLDVEDGLRSDAVRPGLRHDQVTAAAHGVEAGRLRVPRTAADDG